MGGQCDHKAAVEQTQAACRFLVVLGTSIPEEAALAQTSASHIGAMVQVLATLLPTWHPTNVPEELCVMVQIAKSPH